MAITEFGFKKCSLDGRWEGRESGDFSKPAGWTNYTGCYTVSTYEMYAKIFGHVSPGVSLPTLKGLFKLGGGGRGRGRYLCNCQQFTAEIKSINKFIR